MVDKAEDTSLTWVNTTWDGAKGIGIRDRLEFGIEGASSIRLGVSEKAMSEGILTC